MIRGILDDIFSPYSSFGDRFFAALIALFIIGLVGLLSFFLIDSVSITSTKTVVTVVEAKQVVPAHTTTTMVMIGKILHPIITHHPESYYLHFKIDDEELDSGVEKEFFDTVDVGERIEVDYGFGRLSGSYNPVRFRSIPR